MEDFVNTNEKNKTQKDLKKNIIIIIIIIIHGRDKSN
jgi:hypothetical protein